MRHPWTSLALALVIAAAMLGLAAGPAHGSCAGPMMAVGSELDDTAPPTTGTLAIGSEVIVTGLWFHTGCADSYQTTGCSGHPTPLDPEAPMIGVDLFLTQGAHTWILDRQDAADASHRYAITWRATLPAAVEPGPAQLSAASAALDVVVT